MGNIPGLELAFTLLTQFRSVTPPGLGPRATLVSTFQVESLLDATEFQKSFKSRFVVEVSTHRGYMRARFEQIAWRSPHPTCIRARWIAFSFCPVALGSFHWILNGFLKIRRSKESVTPSELASNPTGRLEMVWWGPCPIGKKAKQHRTQPWTLLCGLVKTIISSMRLIFKCKLILELTLQERLLHGGFVTEIKSIGNTFIVPSLWAHLVFTVIAPIIMNLFEIHVALPHINRVSATIHHPISIS